MSRRSKNWVIIHEMLHKGVENRMIRLITARERAISKSTYLTYKKEHEAFGEINSQAQASSKLPLLTYERHCAQSIPALGFLLHVLHLPQCGTVSARLMTDLTKY